MSKADNRKSRSRREICLKLTIETSKKKSWKQKHHSKQKHVHSTSGMHLTEVLDVLKGLNKETQSLPLTLIDFTSCFRVSVANLEQAFVC